MFIPNEVKVVEVGPRDGLQSLPKWIDTADKIRMIDRLSRVGFPTIEATSFASPRFVPNLADAEAVMAGIERREGTRYRVLVPNARGAERAVASRPDEMLGLITLSHTYLHKNQNMTLDEARDEAIAAFNICDKSGIDFVMAIGMAFWCAYEGAIGEDEVIHVVDSFRHAGIRRFYLAGSLGMEDPAHVSRLFARVKTRYPEAEFGYHPHNLSGFGTANVLAALDAGADWIEGSICGIGGGVAVPDGLGAVGNLPTEDIVSMLSTMNVNMGVTLTDTLAASRDVAALIDIRPNSHAAVHGTREEIHAASLKAAAQTSG